MKTNFDIKYLKYYVANKLVKHAEWNEHLKRFYVKIEDDYMSLSAADYEYLKKMAKWPD